MQGSFRSITMFLFGNCVPNKPYYIIFFINLLMLFPCKVVGQTSNPSSSPPSDNVSDFPASGTYHFSPAMSVIFVIIVVVFFMIGCFSVFGRRCIESRNERSGLLQINQVNRRSRRAGEGLDSNVIDTFPTFLYSDVKKVKIGGTAALECAICLNEFKDDETLRLVPKCCHVFHPECIDTWLTSHVTCPVCRADLVPVPGETGTINCGLLGSRNLDEDEATRTTRLDQEETDTVLNSPSHQVVNGIFGRSHSTDDSVVQANNNYERFTLRLPEDVQKKLTKPELRRAKSNLVFPSASSSKRGYRSSSSVGPSHQQSNREDRWGFTMGPPFLIRSSSVQAPSGGDEGNVVMASGSSSKPNKSPFEWLFSGSRSKDEAGERSSAKLMGNNIV